jgi:hypothetical protein
MRRDFKAGIWFWSGAAVFSLVNMIMNYRKVVQGEILNYDYIIFGVAVIGLILNFILSGRKKGDEATIPGPAVMKGNRKRILEWAVGFWAGIGLMSIINVWKLTRGNDAIRYSRIMSGISVIFVFVCLIWLFVIKRRGSDD